jgi:hypothetical protein
MFEGLAMEDVGVFMAIFFLFSAKWYIVWPFDTFCGHLVYIFPALVYCTEKKLAALSLGQQSSDNNSFIDIIMLF